LKYCSEGCMACLIESLRVEGSAWRGGAVSFGGLQRVPRSV
jgi:hypothetical protein